MTIPIPINILSADRWIGMIPINILSADRWIGTISIDYLCADLASAR